MELSENWTIYHGDDILDGISLHKFRGNDIPDLKIGDEVVMERILPDTINDLETPTMEIDVRYAALSVQIDDDLLYTWKKVTFDLDEYIGTCKLYVPLDENQDGKVVRLTYYISQEPENIMFDAPLLGEFGVMFRADIKKNLITYIISVFLVVYGIAFTIINWAFLKTSKVMGISFMSSVMSTVLGMWLICSEGLGNLLIARKDLSGVETVCLFLLLPLAVFMLKSFHATKRPYLFDIIGYIYVVVDIVVLALFLRGKEYVILAKNIFGAALIIFTIMLLVLCVRLYFVRGHHISEVLHLLSLTALFFLIIMDEAVDVAMPETRMSFFKNGLHLLPIGAFIFVMLELLNYFVFLARSYAEQIETDSLSKIAYKDMLTNLNNRAGCEAYLRRIDAEDNDYVIASIDLNGLKKINDTMGHIFGDRMIREFGTYMNDIFEERDFTGRMGGDEFIVITKGSDEKRMYNMLEKLTDYIKEKDADSRINHSFSYGVATSFEADKTSASVYMLADDRMYEMKRKYKEDCARKNAEQETGDGAKDENKTAESD